MTKKISHAIMIAVTCCLLLPGCTGGKVSDKHRAEVTSRLIPLPESVHLHPGYLDLSGGVFIEAAPNVDSTLTKRWSDYLRTSPLSVAMNGKKLALMLINQEKNNSFEAYQLEVNKRGITLSANSEAGLFYGLQTLLQLVEVDTLKSCRIPFVTITDTPRFPHRGLMIDCSRHFFSIEFLKKQIDMMAHYKLNRFHWHLTDDPGWRLEIARYPELTRVTAWHKEKEWSYWLSAPRKYVPEGTPGAYGGYYTREDAKELVRYAAERHIIVIPEIEMPGHSAEVLAVYPQLSCSGKPYTSNVFCVGNEETFVFLENVLNEVMDIFPSDNIHIGADEVNKKHWRVCPKCRNRMKENGLTNEDELQGYLVKRIGAFLQTNGKKLIGWDEILDGGVPSDATVMSWRGERGGIAAAQSGHSVIMCPGDYCYIDHYQWIPETQPEAIGDFLPLEKMYSYNPVPEVLNENKRKYIIGAQANLWTEYIGTEAYAEYMIYPRLLALAEITWSRQEQRSWDDFKVRVNRAVPLLQQQGYNTYPLSREPLIETTTDFEKEAIAVSLTSELYPAEIRCTTDGTEPTAQSSLYHEPVMVKEITSFAARLFNGEEPLGEAARKLVGYHKAINKQVSYLTPYSPNYPAEGDKALVDGYKGMTHGDGYWQGFNVPRVAFVIDLGQTTSIQRVQINFEQNTSSEIFFPKEVAISFSGDGEKYGLPKTMYHHHAPVGEFDIKRCTWENMHEEARFIKVEATANNGWLFIDEVEVW